MNSYEYESLLKEVQHNRWLLKFLHVEVSIILGILIGTITSVVLK